jgi:adenosylcobinamide kinase/adenosylcobinamide-phosphate guanylyltransferase
MNILVTGGNKSGKSAYAERTALQLSEGTPVLYIATMKAKSDEDFAIVRRHEAYRRGKPFNVIEQEMDLETLVFQKCKVAMLEDLPNLVANEIFDGGSVGRIESGIRHIASMTEHLILITNEIDSDGIRYTDETQVYMRELGRINAACAVWCDRVIECVVGIPLILKGEPLRCS